MQKVFQMAALNELDVFFFCMVIINLTCLVKAEAAREHINIRDSHTFSIPASIIGEVPHASFPLGTRILRSAHSPIISHSRSPPPTLKNWASRNFL